MKNIKIVFMGSPDFAIPSLELLIENYSVVGIITQPNKPAGRRKELKPPSVKLTADKFGLETIQPNKLRDEGVFEQLKKWNPDLIIVVAFGQILRQEVLDLPKFGCINVHASLLPRWRGAAPIHAAILNGDRETGITIMKLDAGVDTGPILCQKPMQIFATETYENLSKRLARMGSDLLLEVLPDYLTGKIKPVKQSDTGVTNARILKKEDGLLDFTKTSQELERQIRAFYPWPGSYFIIGSERINVIKAEIGEFNQINAGERGKLHGYPIIGTSNGSLLLNEVQPAGKKIMSGKIFLNGYRNW